MKRLFFSVSLAVLTAFCLAIATARPAWGYVDPGSGFLAVQTVASVAAAFGYFLRRRLRSLFSKKQTPAVLPTGLQEGDRPSTD
jgi:hypothetical protein